MRQFNLHRMNVTVLKMYFVKNKRHYFQQKLQAILIDLKSRKRLTELSENEINNTQLDAFPKLLFFPNNQPLIQKHLRANNASFVVIKELRKTIAVRKRFKSIC